MIRFCAVLILSCLLCLALSFLMLNTFVQYLCIGVSGLMRLLSVRSLMPSLQSFQSSQNVLLSSPSSIAIFFGIVSLGSTLAFRVLSFLLVTIYCIPVMCTGFPFRSCVFSQHLVHCMWCGELLGSFVLQSLHVFLTLLSLGRACLLALRIFFPFIIVTCRHSTCICLVLLVVSFRSPCILLVRSFFPFLESLCVVGHAFYSLWAPLFRFRIH